MILGMGLDVVELARIAASLERFGDRFLARILQRDPDRSQRPSEVLFRLLARGFQRHSQRD